MKQRIVLNRMEAAGSLGDLGTLLPIAIAMVMLNGMSPMGVFFSIGVYYILSGLYFGITVPVQPMKVIGAYAIATAMTPEQILASCLLMGAGLLITGLTGAIDMIAKITPKPVIRGVQLSTGVLLMSGGIRFMMGTSTFQAMQEAVEPHLVVQALGPLPISLVIGAIGTVLTLLLLDNRRFPAGLMVVAGGFLAGLALGGRITLGFEDIGLHFPALFPAGFPGGVDFTFALFALVLPQLPMTLGNAVLAYTDLSKEYFKDQSKKVSNRNVCVSMALANFFSFCFGGMPMCHGAGGLAAHFRFGARTAGSNLIIGAVFAAMAILLGSRIIDVLNLLPMSILGVLLVFAGVQLALAVMDLNTRKEYFTATLILGITLAANLAAGFIAGMAAAHLLRWDRLSV